MGFNNILKKLKFLKTVCRERKTIQSLLESDNYQFLIFAQPGHFYSPIPDIKEIELQSEIIFDRSVKKVPGIHINEEAQLGLTKKFIAFYNEIPFSDNKNMENRYYFENAYFSYGDAVILYSIIRFFKPRKIIEIGSGFSSAAMLDINERFFDGKIEFTFIEPHPDRLFSLLRAKDKELCSIEKKPVQQVKPEIFLDLKENDILFIDSSHVAKTYSDVLHILFKILPFLKAGVLVHFHDILWPFEYPKIWLDRGRAWNEAYIVRAFLQYNTSFEILYFSSFMEIHYASFLRNNIPLALKIPSSEVTPGNTSLWIRKVL
jgi:predicted O-methyltransferase YrrM